MATEPSLAAAAHILPAAPGPCPHFDPRQLEHELAHALGELGLHQSLRDSHPHLFSSSSVFVRPADLERMRAVIVAAEQVIATAGYRRQVIAGASPTAQHDPRTAGACLGYDFHFGPDGPRLIEINTNAGGALLALALTRAHLACCAPLRERLPGLAAPQAVEDAIAEMFVEEWRAARGDRPLRSVAIVDTTPEQQFLHPEFVLYRELFRRHGIEALIADPGALTLHGRQLRLQERVIDLVYNRLTDFALAEPAHTVLRAAYLDDLAVITPHPRAHALYADKRNLAILTDDRLLREFGVAETTIDILRHGVAHTRPVERAEADRLWAQRKGLFFKPVSGYGSKAVYRGDKLTKRVWEEILAGDYVAQTLVPPAEQAVTRTGEETLLKYDVRNFVYRGQVQLLAARLYQGQTTNFRTPGGGFAPVFRAAGSGS
jgi:hypothetical protein